MPFVTSHTDVEARYLMSVLRPGARALDAGCGRTTRLRKYRSTIAELIGLDLDEAAGLENVSLDRFVVGDMCEQLPFESGSFDLVYTNFVIEHLAVPEAAFSEWHRVLRPDGALIFLTSNQANPLIATARHVPHELRVRLKQAGAGVHERDVIRTYYRANTPGRLGTLLAQAGFAPVAVSYVATLHRYAAQAPALARSLCWMEHALPPRLRSTIVAWYRPF